ncbi:hypothetical protein C5167_030802 [Papaver somniferum]|nr:hypothetical protein C5167_030802 [Papaver somniferum]
MFMPNIAEKDTLNVVHKQGVDWLFFSLKNYRRYQMEKAKTVDSLRRFGKL